MLEKKGIKKIGFRDQKGSTGRGYGQPAQPVEEPVDRLWSSSRGPIKVRSMTGRGSVEVRSRTGRGPVEATVTCHALNAPTASEPVNP